MNYQLLSAEEVVDSNPDDLYSFTVYKGEHQVNVGPRDSFWYIDGNAVRTASNEIVESAVFGVMIYGYTPFNRTCEINTWTTLPYVNGCSTTELLPPIRKGDPTFQLLYIPPHSAEQVHHIHSTARIVYVWKGSGRSIIGQSGKYKIVDLKEGTVLLLNKMIPHHFETDSEELVVLPLHIFSSVGKSELDHPMFNGTHLS